MIQMFLSAWPAIMVHAVEIAVFAMLVALVCRVLGRRWPHLAYALWLVVLVKCVTPPVVSFKTDLGLSEPAARSSAAPLDQTDVSSSAVAAQSSVDSGDNRVPESGYSLSAGELLVAAWAVGGLLLAGLVVGKQAECLFTLRRTARPLPDELAAWLERRSEELGLAKAPQVLVTPLETGPAVTGVFRPAICVPESLLDSMPRDRLQAMLTHELTHIRRRDSLTLLVQFFVQVLWWPHPVVWWMNRQIVRHRERCCDEEVVAGLGGSRGAYAQALVDVLESKHSLRPLLGLPGMRPAELTRNRLEEIMKRPNMTHTRAPLWSWATALVVAALVLPFSVTQSEAIAESEPTRVTKKHEKPLRLQYGDGKADGKKSIGGSGHLIRFTLPDGEPALKAIRIHGSRYGAQRAPQEDFDVTILSDDMEEVIGIQRAPYGLFRRGKEKWVTVRFEDPIAAPKTFWVALDFHAHQTKGVYLSYDDSTKGEHSRMGLVEEPEKVEKLKFKADWMVQVVLDWDE